jgi:hypothetical protein
VPLISVLKELAFTAMGKEGRVPASLKEAKGSAEWAQWKEAMDVEISQLVKQGVFSLVQRQAGLKTVGTKWVFDLKLGPNGEVLRHKARLVAQGFSQVEGVHYTETFAPVIAKESLRTLIAVAAKKDWEIEQADISCAFLHGELEEEIYCEIPEGFSGDRQTQIFKIEKSLYGLKQASRQYNKALDEHLRSKGYLPLKADPCVYVKRDPQNSNHVVGYIGVWVDDLFIFGEKEQTQAAKVALKDRFEIKDLGPARWMLGFELVRDRVNRTASLLQSRYIENMLSLFNMSDCKAVATPLPPGAIPLLKACSDEQPLTQEEAARIDKIPYRKAIGILLYLSTTSRPDIAYAVSQLSRFVDSPRIRHYTSLKHLLRYLKGTKDFGLVLGGKGDFVLGGYSDSDWASNQEDRRSMGGYCFTTGPTDGVVAWASKGQHSVALSSLEAEYMALSDAARTAIWLRYLFEELNLPSSQSPTQIQCDNQAAIFTSSNPSTSPKTKHIAIRYHFIRERILETKELSVQYVQSSQQLADIFTKSMKNIAQFQELRSRLGVRIISL